MKKKITFVLILLFVVISTCLVGYFTINKPRLLILHSYDSKYSWVRDVNIGLDRVLGRKGGITIRWHYLDTKNHPWKEYKQNAGIMTRRLIDTWHPNVILAVDDDAQHYVTSFYNNHPDISIVFSGVNSDPGKYGFDKANNVTGILERLPLKAVRETLLIAPRSYNTEASGPIRVVFIGDKSETVLGDEAGVRAFDWKPIVLLPSKLVDTWEEWQQAVQEANKTADFILTSNYRRVLRRDKTLIPPRELVEWTEQNSCIPVIGTNGFFAEDGGMLAIGTSPFEQGEVAAKQALQIIEKGRRAIDIPVVKTEAFIVTMSETRMKARNFKLPSVYEAAARANDKYYQ